MMRLPHFAVATLIAALLTTSGTPAQAAGVPAFVPKPSAIYDGFVAINGPRADVPVGALWIDGYGPHGEGGKPDNLETVRGLSGIAISRDLELSLTAGLLDLLGIDPALRKHFQARFSELSIVRVKDVSRLSGPVGEPRIIEAMKAASILITSEQDFGLDLEKRSLATPFAGTLDSGSKRGFTIEGREMFIAMRVAKSRASRSEPTLLKFERSGELWAGDAHGLSVIARIHRCTPESNSACRPKAEWGIYAAGTVPANAPALSTDLRHTLPMPRSDGHGGLYTSAELNLLPPCRERRAESCGSEWRAWLSLVGDRMEDTSKPRAPRW